MVKRKDVRLKENVKRNQKNNFLGILLMSKPGKVLKGLCKKLGVRLTVKRGKKRVYKSIAVLKRQCAAKKKKKKVKKKVVKRRRRFGMAPPYMSYQTIDSEGTYIGGRKNGKKHGRGKMTYSHGSVYIGNWKNDKKEGQGRMDYSSGSNYVGEWKNGLMDGKGRMNSRIGIYEGEWKDNKYDDRPHLGLPTWFKGKKVL